LFREQSHDGQCRERLAGTRFTYQSDGLTFFKGQVNAADGSGFFRSVFKCDM